ncbi:hypothetical protein IV203_031603 [Nitzschia inconspicua]|uniref:Uncharacterized protein n=1 Tax=Nitzschia inconspicua TaxID=303405 RepID=A0A9K3Q3A4_9STRA|nr:hypothetical protein IV203_011176 [Nitzschia inconspicua]KAG7368860.1 hypothetical protein IV203_031603 [Nitzschia inconspicua]
MPLTKSQPAQALEHILTNVFDLEAKDPLRAALRDNGFVDIYDLVNMERKHVEDLAYLDEVDGTQQRIPIPWGKREIINVFRDYIIYRHEINEPIGINWTDITMEQFNKFRIDPSYLRARLLAKDGVPVFKPVTNPPAPTTPVMTNDCTPANQLFQKEIERDQSLFPILKTEQPNDSRHRKFEIQAHAQGVAHVVDNKYSPTNPGEKEVFKPIQTFVEAVLESKVQTSKGKEAIREQKATKDAPAAYANLVERHRKSNAANIEATKTNITTTTISNGEFKGTASEFLTNWIKQLKPYGNLTGNGSFLGEIVKVLHLSQASATVSEFRQVKLTTEVLQMSTKNPIDFQQYCRLLSAAAVQYEDSLTHDDDPWDPGDLTHEDDPWDPGDSFNIDTLISQIEAYAHVSRPRKQRGPSMGSPSNRSSQRILIPKEVWHTLCDDFQVAWSNLPEEEKAMILSTGLPSNNPRVVQLHEQSQDADMEEEFQDAVADSPVEPAQGNDQVQVHNAQQQSVSKFPPYDIRAILSSKGKQVSTLQAKMCITSTPIVYRVSATSVKSKQSLIDRGANGGIAGQDCKVICISDRTVDVQGIDNHQLNSVSIGTAAGYVESHKGPVILILHQYALVGRGHSIHSPGQLEWYKHSVCDKSVHVGGLQRIKTADGYNIPLAMVHGLPRVRMRPPTDKDFNTLPLIVMTSDTTWDPSVLDFDHEEADDQWFDTIEHQEAHPYSVLFYECGNYRQDVTVQISDTLCRPSSDPSEHLIDPQLFFFDAQSHSINETSPLVAPSTPRVSSTSTPDYEMLDTQAADCGATRCQVLVGMNTDVTDVYLLQTSKQFVNLLEDNVQFWGAPTKFEADSAPIDISGRVKIVSLTALLGVTVDPSVLDAVTSILLHLRPTSDGALNI